MFYLHFMNYFHLPVVLPTLLLVLRLHKTLMFYFNPGGVAFDLTDPECLGLV